MKSPINPPSNGFFRAIGLGNFPRRWASAVCMARVTNPGGAALLGLDVTHDTSADLAVFKIAGIYGCSFP
jgi:hypothetical protein